jgi:hypothetical protein
MYQQRFAGNWHKLYSACDLHLVFDGAKPSVHKTLGKTTPPSKKYVRYANAIGTTISTLGIRCDVDINLLDKRMKVVRALKMIGRHESCNEQTG